MMKSFVAWFQRLADRAGHDPHDRLYEQACQLIDHPRVLRPIDSAGRPVARVEIMHGGQIVTYRQSGVDYVRSLEGPAVLALRRNRFQPHLLGQVSIFTKYWITTVGEPGRVTAIWIDHVPVDLPVRPR